MPDPNLNVSCTCGHPLGSTEPLGHDVLCAVWAHLRGAPPAPSCGEECAEGHVHAGRCALAGQPAPDCDCDETFPDPCPGRENIPAARTTPDSPATSSDGANNCLGVETVPNRCVCPCEGCRHHCGAHQDPAVAAPATPDDCPGLATVTITVHAPDQAHADRWAQVIADLVRVEQGDQMPLDIRVTPGTGGTP